MKRRVAGENRVYTCHIIKVRHASDPTPLSSQMDVVMSAVQRLLIKIRHEDTRLKGGVRGRNIINRNSLMIMRPKPNFLTDGSNFRSPPIPLHGNLKDPKILSKSHVWRYFC